MPSIAHDLPRISTKRPHVLHIALGSGDVIYSLECPYESLTDWSAADHHWASECHTIQENPAHDPDNCQDADGADGCTAGTGWLIPERHTCYAQLQLDEMGVEIFDFGLEGVEVTGPIKVDVCTEGFGEEAEAYLRPWPTP